MLETELFALLDHTGDAAYTVDAEGIIRSWNVAAERLFGWKADDAMGRHVDTLFRARDSLGTGALAGGADAATRQSDASSGLLADFDIEVLTSSGRRIWINVSTILFNNPRTRTRLFVRLARDVTPQRQRERRLNRLVQLARGIVAFADKQVDGAPVQALSDQERRILRLFAAGSGPSTICNRLRISGQTLRNHLHHINVKLRTHNRLEAVTHAQRRGLLE